MQGKVVNDVAYLTTVGMFEVDVAIEGRVLLVRQKDQPGLIAAVAKVLAEDNVNVAYMTVSRTIKGTAHSTLLWLFDLAVATSVCYKEA